MVSIVSAGLLCFVGLNGVLMMAILAVLVIAHGLHHLVDAIRAKNTEMIVGHLLAIASPTLPGFVWLRILARGGSNGGPLFTGHPSWPSALRGLLAGYTLLLFATTAMQLWAASRARDPARLEASGCPRVSS
jgi:hypothetical protein